MDEKSRDGISKTARPEISRTVGCRCLVDVLTVSPVGFHCFLEGARPMFKLEGYEGKDFFPNLGMSVHAYEPGSDRGTASIDLLVPENDMAHFLPGVSFTLHSGPSNLVGIGRILDVNPLRSGSLT